MLAGPIFVREAITVPRRFRHYLARSICGSLLFVLLWTAWQVIVGFQRIESAGDVARFGAILFQWLSLLQLGLVFFFSPIVSASSVATEKDRRTFVLLLMTDLKSSEIVFGKLAASLLQMAVFVVAIQPIFAISLMLGGASAGQMARIFLITCAVIALSGSLGILIASWRDKMFQSVALSLLALVIYLVATEIFAGLVPNSGLLGISGEGWRAALNPFQSVLAVVDPIDLPDIGWLPYGQIEWVFVAFTALLTVVIVGTTISTLRRWNIDSAIARGPIEVDEEREKQKETSAQSKRSRNIWTNPILWREVKTRAYGRKPLIVKFAYVFVFVLIVGAYFRSGLGPTRTLPPIAYAIVPITLISLLLANVQAVTSVTSEKDGRSLDLLLVSDITPKEFIFGKLLGVLYNIKEMLVLPLCLCFYFLFFQEVELESWICLVFSMLILFGFACVLGLHAAMSYDQSRTAVVNSVGTIVFLFVGIAACILLIVISGRFEAQVASFVIIICAGAVAMYVSLAVRNQSGAFAVTAFMCPAMTWWAIANFLKPNGSDPLGLFAVLAMTYGFAIASMLIPAISEFDVALGRTVSDGAE